jgi:hypothetical protein
MKSGHSVMQYVFTILTLLPNPSLNSDFSAFQPSIGFPKAAHGQVSGSQFTARLQFQQSWSGFFFAIRFL